VYDATIASASGHRRKWRTGSISLHDAATVIKIAAGKKNIPTENMLTKQPSHSSAVETVLADRRWTRSGTRAARTRTYATIRTHVPRSADCSRIVKTFGLAIKAKKLKKATQDCPPPRYPPFG